MSGNANGGRWLLHTAVAGVLALAAGAFVLSYSALHAVAVAAGIDPTLAGLYPLIIDGFLSIASLAALHLRDHGPRVTWYPWALLGGFFTVSVWCNALHAASRDGQVALSGPTAALVSAMPPVALGLAIHLLILMLRPTRTTTTTATGQPEGSRANPPSKTPNAPASRPAHLNGAAPTETATRAPRTNSAPKTRPTVSTPTPIASADGNDLHRRAVTALREAQERDTELTGAELGRRLGVSTRHGRRLLHSLQGEPEPSTGLRASAPSPCPAEAPEAGEPPTTQPTAPARP